MRVRVQVITYINYLISSPPAGPIAGRVAADCGTYISERACAEFVAPRKVSGTIDLVDYVIIAYSGWPAVDAVVFDNNTCDFNVQLEFLSQHIKVWMGGSYSSLLASYYHQKYPSTPSLANNWRNLMR